MFLAGGKRSRRPCLQGCPNNAQQRPCACRSRRPGDEDCRRSIAAQNSFILALPPTLLDVLGSRDAEVLPLIEQRIQILVLKADATAFDGVEYLGRMEAEHGSIAESRRAIAASVLVHALDAEGMRGIIDDLKPVTVSDSWMASTSQRLP